MHDASPLKSLAVYPLFGDVTDEELPLQIITDAEAIWNFDVFSCLLTQKSDEGHWIQSQWHDATLVVQGNETIIINLNGLGGGTDVKYARMSFLSIDNKPKDDCRSTKTENAPTVLSILISSIETDDSENLQLYNEVATRTEEKLSKSEDLDELELEYYYGRMEFRGYDDIGYGNWLYGANRYYDAYTRLDRAFTFLKPQVYDGNEELRKPFLEVSVHLADCLTKMEREDEAWYYYNQASEAQSTFKPNQLAMSYARLGSPFAMNVMKQNVEFLSAIGHNQEKWSKDFKNFAVQLPITLCKYKQQYDKQLQASPLYDSDVSISSILDVFLGLKKKHLLPRMKIYNVAAGLFLDTIEDIDTIASYHLNTDEAKDKVFVLRCTNASYKIDRNGGEVDQSILSDKYTIIITTHSICAVESHASMRVDVMVCNHKHDDAKRCLERLNTPRYWTFSLGSSADFCFSADKESLGKATNMLNELFYERRFFETLKLGMWTFECASHLLKSEDGTIYESEDQDLWTAFYEAAFHVGFALMDIGLMPKAAYYLEVAQSSKNYNYVREYVNFYCNTKDLRAIEVIDHIIAHSPKPQDLEFLPYWNSFMAFLKRRKAYVLIDMKSYEDAKVLLTELLNDPQCSGFAAREIHYLEQVMGNGEN